MATLPLKDSPATRFAMYDLCCAMNAEQIEYLRRIERGYKRVGICEPDGFGGYLPPMVMAAFNAIHNPRHLTMVVTARRALAQTWMHSFKAMLDRGRSPVKGALEVISDRDNNFIVVNRIHKSYLKINTVLSSMFVGFKTLDANYKDASATIIIEGFDSIPKNELDAVLALGELPHVQIVLVARKTSEKPSRKPPADVE